MIRIICVSVLFFATTVFAQEWTRFRGPNGSGISSATTVPTQWSDSDYKWKIKLPGRGHSSPVLWGNKLFTSSADQKKGGVTFVCLNADDGSTVWKREVSFAPTKQHKFNSFACTTPALDEKHAYMTWGNNSKCVLTAWDHDGKTVWEYNLGPIKSQHGFGFSPVIYNGTVIVENEQLGNSYLVAVNCETGKQVWKTQRDSGFKTAYSTPVIYTPSKGRPQLVVHSQANGITGVDAATGKQLWQFKNAFAKRTVSSPVLAGDIVFGTCGAGGGGDAMFAVQIPASGSQVTQPFDPLTRAAPYVPTAVVYKGHVYFVADSGVASCVDPNSGEVLWQERLDASGGFFSSPVCVNGVIYCVSKSGNVAVFKAATNFQPVATIDLGEGAYATPAVANGRMYLRTFTRMFCIGG